MHIIYQRNVRIVLLMVLDAILVWHAKLVLQQSELERLEARGSPEHRAIESEDVAQVGIW